MVSGHGRAMTGGRGHTERTTEGEGRLGTHSRHAACISLVLVLMLEVVYGDTPVLWMVCDVRAIMEHRSIRMICDFVPSQDWHSIDGLR